MGCSPQPRENRFAHRTCRRPYVAETYPQLKRRAKQEGAKIFFMDEAGFQSVPPVGADLWSEPIIAASPRMRYGFAGWMVTPFPSGYRRS